jgi:hypothetical protein
MIIKVLLSFIDSYKNNIIKLLFIYILNINLIFIFYLKGK